MKKLLLLVCITGGALFIQKTDAQVSVNINIGAQPLWGPIGYDYVDYYYLPDIEVYYYVPRRQYIYMSNGHWVFMTTLPARYRSYDLYRGYKVVINEPRPWLHLQAHKVKYAKFKGNNGRQGVIVNSHDPKYYVVKGHPGNNGRGRGNGKSKH